MRALLLLLSYLILDSTHTDPCEDHTVLSDTWRSTSCRWKECVWDVKCDYGLRPGWYRFKSSGGWKIPEFRAALDHCSTRSPGWLKGSHPTLKQGEVKRTVCFSWYPCSWKQQIKIKNCSSYFVYELKPTPGCYAVYCTGPHPTLEQREVKRTVCFNCDGNSCFWKREIKIKNCSSYFVYELKPTPGCNATYCTDPGKAPPLGAEDKSQPESTDPDSPIPTESPTSGFLSLSEEDCEAMDVEVQVMYVGNNKLETNEQKAAYFQQVQDMVRNYLPCKKLVPANSQSKKKRAKKRK